MEDHISQSSRENLSELFLSHLNRQKKLQKIVNSFSEKSIHNTTSEQDINNNSLLDN